MFVYIFNYSFSLQLFTHSCVFSLHECVLLVAAEMSCICYGINILKDGFGFLFFVPYLRASGLG